MIRISSRSIKYVVAIWILLVCSLHTHAQDFLITTGIMENVYQITTDTGGATAFVIIENGREYLITARHIFRRSIVNGDSVSIKLIQDATLECIAKYYEHDSIFADVAVLVLDSTIAKSNFYPTGGDGLHPGQEAYFIGYPQFSPEQIVTKRDDRSEIFPLVKKSSVAGFSERIIYLDGFNNRGFSGGPTIVYDYYMKRPAIFGIISGFNQDWRQVIYADVTGVKIEMPFYYAENSGIINCVPIGYALDIIGSIK